MANIIPIGSTQASGGTFKGGKAVFSGRLIGSSPTQAEPKNIAFGQGTPAGTRVTALTTDLGLAGEIVANGGQANRVAGTSSQVSTTGGNFDDTYQVQGTLTCNLVGGLAITEAGLFDTTAFPAQTTLNGAITTGTTSVSVTSASGFPGSGTYYCQVGQEVVAITAGQGTTTWTVTRAQNGTTAVNHANGDFITCIGNATQGGTGNGGIMTAKGDFAVINLAQNDTLQLTASIQFT